jgi:hypothetical protein
VLDEGSRAVRRLDYDPRRARSAAAVHRGPQPPEQVASKATASRRRSAAIRRCSKSSRNSRTAKRRVSGTRSTSGSLPVASRAGAAGRRGVELAGLLPHRGSRASCPQRRPPPWNESRGRTRPRAAFSTASVRRSSNSSLNEVSHRGDRMSPVTCCPGSLPDSGTPGRLLPQEEQAQVIAHLDCCATCRSAAGAVGRPG